MGFALKWWVMVGDTAQSPQRAVLLPQLTLWCLCFPAACTLAVHLKEQLSFHFFCLEFSSVSSFIGQKPFYLGSLVILMLINCFEYAGRDRLLIHWLYLD